MDKTDETIRRPSTWGLIFKSIGLIRESPLGMLGAFLVLFWVLMAVLAPVLPLHSPLEPIMPFQKIGASAPDGSTFWLGTDHKGRDILSRVIWGSQRVLVWA
ncbi:MAG: ABC transporter permease, partial [bacterium]|nr:ABC transporter permease [bacterium]